MFLYKVIKDININIQFNLMQFKFQKNILSLYFVG